MLTKAPLAMMAACLVGVAPLGCTSSSGAQRIDTTTSTMMSVEDQIEQGERRLDALIISLNTLDATQDYDKSYRDFDRRVRDVKATAERIRSRRVEMETQAAEHMTLWRSESASLTRERTQDITAERQQAFEESINRATDALDDLHAEYEEFLSRVDEVRTVLSNDLTRQGVEMTREIRGDVVDMARDLQATSKDVRETVREARTDFTR